MNKTERLEKEKISVSSQDRDLNGEVLVYTGVYDRHYHHSQADFSQKGTVQNWILLTVIS